MSDGTDWGPEPSDRQRPTIRHAEPRASQAASTAALSAGCAAAGSCTCCCSRPLIFALVFLYWPLYGLQLAFKNYNSRRRASPAVPWAGIKYIEQFIELVPVLAGALEHAVLNLYELLALFPLADHPGAAAELRAQPRFSRGVQLITYAPHFISTVVVVGIIIMLFSPDGGLSTSSSRQVAGSPVDFLDATMFRHTYVWSGAWQTLGYSAIIYLAALAGIDPELHEAAQVDGASIWRRIWHIDLPGILPVTITLLILNMGSILTHRLREGAADAEPAEPRRSREVIDTYSLPVAFVSAIPQYSYATAIGLFKSVIALVMLLMANYLARRVAKQSLF